MGSIPTADVAMFVTTLLVAEQAKKAAEELEGKLTNITLFIDNMQGISKYVDPKESDGK